MKTKLQPEMIGFLNVAGEKRFKLTVDKFDFLLDCMFGSSSWFMWVKPVTDKDYILAGTFNDCHNDDFITSTSKILSSNAIDELLSYIKSFERKKVIDGLLDNLQ